jgi:hypothetical protein
LFDGLTPSLATSPWLPPASSAKNTALANFPIQLSTSRYFSHLQTLFTRLSPNPQPEANLPQRKPREPKKNLERGEIRFKNHAHNIHYKPQSECSLDHQFPLAFLPPTKLLPEVDLNAITPPTRRRQIRRLLKQLRLKLIHTVKENTIAYIRHTTHTAPTWYYSPSSPVPIPATLALQLQQRAVSEYSIIKSLLQSKRGLINALHQNSSSKLNDIDSGGFNDDYSTVTDSISPSHSAGARFTTVDAKLPPGRPNPPYSQPYKSPFPGNNALRINYHNSFLHMLSQLYLVKNKDIPITKPSPHRFSFDDNTSEPSDKQSPISQLLPSRLNPIKTTLPSSSDPILPKTSKRPSSRSSESDKSNAKTCVQDKHFGFGDYVSILPWLQGFYRPDISPREELQFYTQNLTSFTAPSYSPEYKSFQVNSTGGIKMGKNGKEKCVGLPLSESHRHSQPLTTLHQFRMLDPNSFTQPLDRFLAIISTYLSYELSLLYNLHLDQFKQPVKESNTTPGSTFDYKTDQLRDFTSLPSAKSPLIHTSSTKSHSRRLTISISNLVSLFHQIIATPTHPLHYYIFDSNSSSLTPFQHQSPPLSSSILFPYYRPLFHRHSLIPVQHRYCHSQYIPIYNPIFDKFRPFSNKELKRYFVNLLQKSENEAMNRLELRSAAQYSSRSDNPSPIDNNQHNSKEVRYKGKLVLDKDLQSYHEFRHPRLEKDSLTFPVAILIQYSHHETQFRFQHFTEASPVVIYELISLGKCTPTKEKFLGDVGQTPLNNPLLPLVMPPPPVLSGKTSSSCFEDNDPHQDNPFAQSPPSPQPPHQHSNIGSNLIKNEKRSHNQLYNARYFQMLGVRNQLDDLHPLNTLDLGVNFSTPSPLTPSLMLNSLTSPSGTPYGTNRPDSPYLSLLHVLPPEIELQGHNPLFTSLQFFPYTSPIAQIKATTVTPTQPSLPPHAFTTQNTQADQINTLFYTTQFQTHPLYHFERLFFECVGEMIFYASHTNFVLPNYLKDFQRHFKAKHHSNQATLSTLPRPMRPSQCYDKTKSQHQHSQPPKAHLNNVAILSRNNKSQNNKAKELAQDFYAPVPTEPIMDNPSPLEEDLSSLDALWFRELEMDSSYLPATLIPQGLGTPFEHTFYVNRLKNPNMNPLRYNIMPHPYPGAILQRSFDPISAETFINANNQTQLTSPSQRKLSNIALSHTLGDILGASVSSASATEEEASEIRYKRDEQAMLQQLRGHYDEHNNNKDEGNEQSASDLSVSDVNNYFQ